MKKYEFTGMTIRQEGKTLREIRALRDFGNVRIGDIGGFIEKEYNLSHKGNCWVYGSAKVFDCAQLFGNAVAKDNAQIGENAWLLDDAVVCDNAQALGNSAVLGTGLVCANTIISGNARVGIKFRTFKRLLRFVKQLLRR